MFPSLPHPRHMPCSECGESVARDARDPHTCDEDRWATYQFFQLRHEVAELDGRLAEYLESPRGRFELWDAARRREQQS
jgi:threonine dehydrogenase-like Zn-dependent dehydrogenase